MHYGLNFVGYPFVPKGYVMLARILIQIISCPKEWVDIRTLLVGLLGISMGLGEITTK